MMLLIDVVVEIREVRIARAAHGSVWPRYKLTPVRVSVVSW